MIRPNDFQWSSLKKNLVNWCQTKICPLKVKHKFQTTQDILHLVQKKAKALRQCIMQMRKSEQRQDESAGQNTGEEGGASGVSDNKTGAFEIHFQ